MVILVVCFIALAITTVVFFFQHLYFDKSSYEESKTNKLEAITNLIGYSNVQNIIFRDSKEAYRSLQTLESDKSILHAYLYHLDNDTLADSEIAGVGFMQPGMQQRTTLNPNFLYLDTCSLLPSLHRVRTQEH